MKYRVLVGAGGFASRDLKTVRRTVFAPRDADAGHGLFESTSVPEPKLDITKEAKHL